MQRRQTPDPQPPIKAQRAATSPDATVPPTGTRPAGVQLRARRSPRLIAIGVLIVVLGALGFAVLFSSSINERQVVTVAHAVARGETVSDDHLAVVTVPERLAVATLPASRRAELVGRTALSDLPIGSFPLVSHVGDDPLPDDQALLGLRLTHGQLPVSPLPGGTEVTLVPVPAHADAATAAETDPALREQSAVVAVAPILLEDASTFVLDVRIPQSEAARLAPWAARGELAVVVTGEG